jgi:hypothetical protein
MRSENDAWVEVPHPSETLICVNKTEDSRNCSCGLNIVCWKISYIRIYWIANEQRFLKVFCILCIIQAKFMYRHDVSLEILALHSTHLFELRKNNTAAWRLRTLAHGGGPLRWVRICAFLFSIQVKYNSAVAGCGCGARACNIINGAATRRKSPLSTLKKAFCEWG